jgi:hypothetical protein
MLWRGTNPKGKGNGTCMEAAVLGQGTQHLSSQKQSTTVLLVLSQGVLSEQNHCQQLNISGRYPLNKYIHNLIRDPRSAFSRAFQMYVLLCTIFHDLGQGTE